MAHLVLLRAANVGGHNVFRPKQVAEELTSAGLATTNIGAAGTFAVHAEVTAARVRAALEEALPIEAAMAVRPAEEVLGLLERDPFAAEPAGRDGAKAEVTVLLDDVGGGLAPPNRWPGTDEDPNGDDVPWEVRHIATEGPWHLTWRIPGGRLQPYRLIGDATGAPATTRTWNTLKRAGRALRDGA